MLQAYPHGTLDNVERILQTANDLGNRRNLERSTTQPATQPQTLGLGARIVDSMWKGFTNQVDDQDDSPESDLEKRDDGNETERPSGPTSGFTLSSVLGGLRQKQQVVLPVKKELLPLPTDAEPTQPAPGPAGGLWNYAEKVKDSDAVATLSKVGTNWRARAATLTIGGWGRNTTPAASPGQYSSLSAHARVVSDHQPSFGSGDRRASNVSDPLIYHQPSQHYSPSSIHADSPHDYSSSSTTSSSMTSSPAISPQNTGNQNPDSFVHKTKYLLSIAKSPVPTPRHSPRPLLLNSASPITSPTPPTTHFSASRVPKTPDASEWAEVMAMKKRAMRQESVSSISSLSPSEAFKSGNRSDRDSDTGSRRVPLNRRSISPMIPNYRLSQIHLRNTSTASDPFATSRLTPDSALRSPPPSAPLFEHNPRLSVNIESPVPSPAINSAPILLNTRKSASPQEMEPPGGSQKRFITPAVDASGSTTDDSEPVQMQSNTVAIGRQQRVRSKKYPSRPANLQIRDSFPKARTSIEQQTPSPSSASRTMLTVDYPGEEAELAATPRATNFIGYADDRTPQRSVSPRMQRSRSREGSNESRNSQRRTPTEEVRPRKLSSNSRKVSAGDRNSRRSRRESQADEGDDEGYDDLLSAYESEEDPRGVRQS